MKTLIKQLVAITAALAASSALAASGWSADYDKALEQAKKENKAVLLNFTGSDWCSWCIKLEKDIFSQPKFQEYAKEKLVLVEVDFPQGKQLAKETQKQNEKLQKQFKAEGFPTLVLVGADGKKLGEQVGYIQGGPDALISKLEGMKK